MDAIARNQEFLRRLFTGAPVDRHAFVTVPPLQRVCDGPDNDVTTVLVRRNPDSSAQKTRD